ncbi:hypothetical protein [Nitrococcus mobilis]|uniref:Uncharacterized protein n=1 Tax=Nitrococcus mobilis Nb-231 TaxID=314278 RepID=A4BU57_9GAMM|nr:hypothetical protein [Nitrococcus mobilis]EAR20731.1 hypothetical protein NB231_12611 [Nitrococcus mobilis Nb-231]
MPGQYASLYDNVFIPGNHLLGKATTGVFKYPEIYHWDWQKMRKRVSDHVPVYLVLGARELMLRKGGNALADGLINANAATRLHRSQQRRRGAA